MDVITLEVMRNRFFAITEEILIYRKEKKYLQRSKKYGKINKK
jgi:hypothetical protein